MRQLTTSLRLAVSALAVAATAGCMSVGEDAAKPGPAVPVGAKDAAGTGAAAGTGRGSGGHGSGHGGKGATGNQNGKAGEPGKASGATGASPSPGAPDRKSVV